MEKKFPGEREQYCPEPLHFDMDEVQYSDSSEIAGILKVWNNRSAPGDDGVWWKHLKILRQTHPWMLTKLYNSCLENSYFPRSWTLGNVVFIPKPGKNFEVAGALSLIHISEPTRPY